MLTPKLEMSLFGSSSVRVAAPEPVDIRGAKHRAFFALLATAPQGRRSRAFLQATLWGQGEYDTGHQNLRRALSDLRKQMGAAFEGLLKTTNTDVALDLDRVRFIGNPAAGPFLEDLPLQDRAFCDWVDGIRAEPAPVAALFTDAAGRMGQVRARPRVTALPLTTLTDDPELAILADWVAEETCRSLSRSHLLTVISHLSGRAMARRMIDIADVSNTLDVDFVITGMLRRHRTELVADFDFVDARSGTILWTRHVACPAPDFTEEMQDRLINIVQSVGRAIAEVTIGHVRDRPLPDVADHHLMIAGVSMMHRAPMRDFFASRDYLEAAVARMPAAADPRAWLGKWYVLSVFKGISTDRSGDTQKALDMTAAALDLEPESSFGLTIDGFANNNLLKNMDVAEKRYSAALDVNPNESLSWLLRGALMAFRDDGAAAVKACKTARQLSPIDPFGYYYDSLASSAYVAAEDYENALIHADSSLAVNDRHLSTLRTRTTALYHLGRMDEARASVDIIRRRFPGFSLEEYRRSHPSADNRVGQRVIEALQKSGLT